MTSEIDEAVRNRTIMKQKKPSKVIPAIIVILAMILAGAIGWFARDSQANSVEQANPSPQQTSVAQTMKVKEIDRSVTGKSVEQDQKDALKSAQNLINDSKTTDGDVSKRMNAIANGDTSTVPESVKKAVHQSTGYQDNKVMNQNAYNVLIGLANSFGDKDVSAGNDSWNSVYVNPELGVAFVPVSSFSSDYTGVPYTMQMVYVDGQWKFLPQSLVESVNIVGTIKQNIDASSASPSPTTSK